VWEISAKQGDFWSYRGYFVSRVPYLKAEVVWSVRQEMARTVEDVLARTTARITSYEDKTYAGQNFSSRILITTGSSA
jgi:glycerol-3-phosphate dehydrogenase